MDSGNHFCEKSEAVPVKKVSKAMKQYFFIVMFGLMMIYIIRRARLPSSFSHSLRVLVCCRGFRVPEGRPACCLTCEYIGIIRLLPNKNPGICLYFLQFVVYDCRLLMKKGNVARTFPFSGKSGYCIFPAGGAYRSFRFSRFGQRGRFPGLCRRGRKR